MGRKIAWRRRYRKLTDIKVGSDIQSSFIITHESEFHLSTVGIYFQRPAEGHLPNEDIGHFMFDSPQNERERAWLYSITTGYIFEPVEAESKKVPSSPNLVMMRMPQLGKDLKTGGLETEDWELLGTDSEADFSYKQEEGKPNKWYCFDSAGNPVYEVAWEVVEDSLVVTETYIPGQIRKVLRAPLTIDIPSVKAAMLARPPYERDKDGFLIFPWREIGRIIGATLSYENLPQPEPENSS